MFVSIIKNAFLERTIPIRGVNDVNDRRRRENNRRFHGRGRHLGSGASAAKFTVNVWEKS